MDDLINEDVLGQEVDEEENDGTHFFYSEEDGVIESSKKEFQPQDLGEASPEIWSVQGIWNDITEVERRKPKTRDYISFGDIGKKDFWSRYMKMNGVEESNPIENRVIRIFQAGDAFHDLVKGVFKNSGIYIFSQDDLDEKGERSWSEIPATKTQLKQFGAFDVLVGGKPNLKKAMEWIERSDMTQFQKDKAIKIAQYFSDKFPNGLKPMIYEIKSINSMAFWGKKDYLHEAYPHHRHQLFGYLKANHKNPEMLKKVEEAGIKVDSIDEGRLLYISKDDLVMAEFPIHINDKNLEESYKKDIDTMSYYILNKQEPPKPDYIVLNKRKTLSFQKDKIKRKVRGCYDGNWEVSWSSYFTLMTGCKNKKEFEDLLKEEIKNKNELIKKEVLSKVGIIIK